MARPCARGNHISKCVKAFKITPNPVLSWPVCSALEPVNGDFSFAGGSSKNKSMVNQSITSPTATINPTELYGLTGITKLPIEIDVLISATNKFTTGKVGDVVVPLVSNMDKRQSLAQIGLCRSWVLDMRHYIHSNLLGPNNVPNVRVDDKMVSTNFRFSLFVWALQSRYEEWVAKKT